MCHRDSHGYAIISRKFRLVGARESASNRWSIRCRRKNKCKFENFQSEVTYMCLCVYVEHIYIYI